jgi:O-antigen ligase
MYYPQRQRAKWIIILFIVIGAIYPVARIEIMNRTGIPSGVLGAWQDILTLTIFLLAAAERRSRGAELDFVKVTVFGVVACGFFSAVTAYLSAVPLVPILFGMRVTYLPMAFFFVGRWLWLSDSDFRRIHQGFVLLLASTAAVGMLFSYVFKDYWFQIVLASDSRGWELGGIARMGGFRMTGALMDPITFGTACAWGAILSYCFVEGTSGRLRRWLAVSCVGLCTIGAAMSLTRGAWLSLILGLALAIAISSKPWKGLLAGFVAVAIGVTAFGLRLDGTAPGLLELTWQKTVEERNEQRESMWTEAFEAFTRRPFGYGLGAVGHVGNRFQDEVPAGAPSVTDGWYHKLMAEGGFTLLVAFLLFQLITIIHLLRKARCAAPPPVKALRCAIFCIFVVASIQALVSNIWDLYYVNQLLWFLVGIGTRSDGPRARGASRFNSRHGTFGSPLADTSRLNPSGPRTLL